MQVGMSKITANIDGEDVTRTFDNRTQEEKQENFRDEVLGLLRQINEKLNK